MLTGTWLEREKLLAGLFFLLLLLLLLPPPELTVLPPDTFRFRRLFGACLAGSATRTEKEDNDLSNLRRVRGFRAFGTMHESLMSLR